MAVVPGRLKPAPMITKKIRMDEVEENGYKTLIYDKNNHVKILVVVNEESTNDITASEKPADVLRTVRTHAKEALGRPILARL